MFFVRSIKQLNFNIKCEFTFVNDLQDNFGPRELKLGLAFML